MQLFLLLCLTLLSPQFAALRRHHPREKTKGKEASVRPTVAPSSRDFAFDLYRVLASADPGQNVFFSPVGVTMSLATLALAASGHTKAQILEGVGLGSQPGLEGQLHQGFQQLLQRLRQPTADFQLSLGSALFTSAAVGIHDTFLEAVKMLYLADTFSTDFGDPTRAQEQINKYVAEQTKGKIVDLIQNLDSTNVMVMVNYIFFKAKWQKSFSHQNTRKQDFHVTPETAVQVPMMSAEDEYYYFLDRNLSCRVVGLPYQGNATAVFVLPSEGKMEQVENGLSGKTLSKWLQMFRKRQLELYLPKFSIKGSYQLEKILPRMGIDEVFTSHADLSGITSHPNIHVSEMVHKAVMEVDEEGARATAATGTIFTFRSARPSSQRITFNRPFLMFIVKDDYGLFVGKVTQP